MAVLFSNKTTAFTLILMINCTVYCFGQCLQRDTQQATCKNLDNELLKEQEKISELKKCLQSECIKTSLASKSHCINPASKDIPGFQTWRINKTLSTEEFLQEALKKIVIHEIHHKKIKRYFKSVPCYTETKKVRVQITVIKTWIKSIQRSLGFSKVNQMSKPKSLTSTGAKSRKDWYDVQVQMLKNLNDDVGQMRFFFKSKNCIISAC